MKLYITKLKYQHKVKALYFTRTLSFVLTNKYHVTGPADQFPDRVG